VASFQYAVRLMELPQGLFGISLATYLLPTLSGLAHEKKYDEFRKELRQGLSYLVFANWIASVLLVVLAEPIIRLLFEGRKFDATSTDQTTLALVCLAPGLVAFSIVNVLARAFYALGDTKTPMKISVFCLTFNLLLAVVLVWRFKQAGLGIANTISSVVNVSLLLYALRHKLKKLELEPLRKALLPLLLAGAVAGLIAWSGWQIWERSLGHDTIALRIGAVFVPATLASLAYLLATDWAKVGHAREITQLILAKIRRPR
jgi:putative peptidoglycan lipid II flippase